MQVTLSQSGDKFVNAVYCRESNEPFDPVKSTNAIDEWKRLAAYEQANRGVPLNRIDGLEQKHLERDRFDPASLKSAQ